MRVKRIGLLALALVLSLGLMGAGIAYFSDTALVQNTSITAGDTDIRISKDGNTWVDTAALTSLFSVTDWCPGAEFEACLWIKNVGSCDARIALLDWEYNETNMPDFCKVIEVTQYRDKYNGNWHTWPDLSAWDSGHWGGQDNKCSLAEFMIGVPNSAINPWDTLLFDDEDHVLLPANAADTYIICWTLKFMPEAGDAYQNVSISFDIIVAATGLPDGEVADLAAKTDLL